MAHSCFAEVVVPEKKNGGGSGLSGVSHTPELEEAVRSWRGAAEVTLTWGRWVPCVQIAEASDDFCQLVPKSSISFGGVSFECYHSLFPSFDGDCLWVPGVGQAPG